MTVRVLIMGLPGAGKTTLAHKLVDLLGTHSHTVTHLNADQVRGEFNDWDFSHEGRIRQSQRMRTLADRSNADFIIADFVAPLPEMRDHYAAAFTVWVDTIKSSEYADTNSMFTQPQHYDIRVTDWTDTWTQQIIDRIIQ